MSLDQTYLRIAGMRDVLIHNYMGVDVQAVWEVTQNELSSLRQAVEELLEESQN